MSLRRIALRFRPERLDYGTRQILGGVRRFANRAEWHCILDPTAGDDEAPPYHGIVSHDRPRAAEQLRQGGPPVVVVDALHKPPRGLRAVSPRRFAAGTLVCRHLLSREYPRLSYVGYSYHGACALYEEGFVRALRRRGHGARILVIKPRSRHKRTPPSVARLTEVLGEWLGRLEPPAGVFAGVPLLGHVLATAAAERGLRIPEDVGIVVAGDDPFYCEGADCPLTAIDLRLEEVGLRAAMLLERLMDGGKPPIGNLTVKPRLVPRRSTDRRLLDDAAVADALAYIARHCHRALAVPEVAEAVGLGRQQLLRRIRRVRERTVEQEIVLARLDRARDLLAAGRCRVEGVARACGFANAGSFSKAWRRYHGAPPSAARVVRPDAPKVPDPFEEAKRLLATRDYDLGMVAMLTGYRSVRHLRKEFWLREHIGPGEWRKLNRRLPEPKSRRFTMTFVGPTGEVEEERAYDIAAGPPHRPSVGGMSPSRETTCGGRGPHSLCSGNVGGMGADRG